MTPARKTELICLGDELLLGLRTNEHLRYLGAQLSAHALPLAASHEVSDARTQIESTFAAAWRRSDLVITTGGLGPTGDDRTRESLAHVLGLELRHDPATEDRLLRFFADRGYSMTENNLRQCLLLEGAEALPNAHGTAPGQWLERDGKLLVMLPGPPRELCPMFEEQVLPRLVAQGWARRDERTVEFRTSGLGESALADRLERLLAGRLEEIDIAYCAHAGFVDVRLHPRHADVHGDVLLEAGRLSEVALGADFVDYGQPDLARLIVRHLRCLGKRLAVAESCTGGLLASRFTDVPGASKVFLGGVVCYRNETKSALLDVPEEILEQHGAVSPETSVAMATGAAERLGADYALSVTGYAGPEGGREPVGTIYLGYVSPVGVWSRKIVGSGSRLAVKERAVNGALDFMRRKLRKYATQDFLDCMCC
ncbi:MAG: CinA family nicotinamide mononucleotide deamidase-related protein [Opitutales bacterium]